VTERPAGASTRGRSRHRVLAALLGPLRWSNPQMQGTPCSGGAGRFCQHPRHRGGAGTSVGGSASVASRNGHPRPRHSAQAGRALALRSGSRGLRPELPPRRRSRSGQFDGRLPQCDRVGRSDAGSAPGEPVRRSPGRRRRATHYALRQDWSWPERSVCHAASESGHGGPGRPAWERIRRPLPG
jgi:hypothetical protein